jgi:hypothetical protein
MTNFDRVKAMNAEEMAEFLTKEYDGVCSCCAIEDWEKREVRCYSIPGMCTQGVRRWLESEVAEHAEVHSR